MLAYRADANVMLVHARTNAEAKRFWDAMGFAAATVFVSRLANVDGGDWGWEDTVEMEQEVVHLPHVMDAVQKITREAPVRISDPGTVVWANLYLPVGGARWLPAVVLDSRPGYLDLRALGTDDLH